MRRLSAGASMPSEMPARSNKNCMPGDVTMPLRADGADGLLSCLQVRVRDREEYRQRLK